MGLADTYRPEAAPLALPRSTLPGNALPWRVIGCHLSPDDQMTFYRDAVRRVRPGGWVINLDVAGRLCDRHYAEALLAGRSGMGQSISMKRDSMRRWRSGGES